MANAIVPTGRSLKQIESHIQRCADQVRKNGIEIGRDLIEIRDDHLWKKNGYESFDKYLRDKAEELIGQTSQSAHTLIRCAELESRIPENSIPKHTVLKTKHLEVLGRLAPNKPQRGEGGGAGMSKDIKALKPAVIKRVLSDAAKHAENGVGRDTISVRDIQKAVDKELGIDREAERKARAEKAEKEKQNVRQEYADYMELSNFLTREMLNVQDVIKELKKVPGEGWEWLADKHPRLCERFAKVCDELAELLRE